MGYGLDEDNYDDFEDSGNCPACDGKGEYTLKNKRKVKCLKCGGSGNHEDWE